MLFLKKELRLAQREEESFWKQKSRENWLRDGDGNTKFFHASVKANRSKNSLETLIDKNGLIQRSEGSKGEVAVEYFSTLFTSSNPQGLMEMFRDFPQRVSQEMNQRLVQEVSKEEIKDAVFSIKPSSAPGPDGMTGLFYQHYWNIIGDCVTSEIQRFFVDGVLPHEWNYTFICLIPKKPDACQMGDLRPISLCSVLYKVISKVLVNRLKPLLPDLVSPTQSAFVAERLISDNIIIAHEVVHSLRTNSKISSEFLAIKSDMSKAYDRVEWVFLRFLLLALGFHPRWVNWVMICVTSVTFSVLINGQPHGMIVPERGLRQGDPLSPFLFVLCTEFLTHLLIQAELRGKITGIQFSPSGPVIHHLFFADDSLLVCKADKQNVEEIRAILDCYESVSGQLVNPAKSSISFGVKVEEDIKAEIQELLGIRNEGGAGTYLGLPECFSGSKIEMLDFLNASLKNRVSGWFARSLSLGGKEVLLKTVAMAMPVHAMSVFKLPKATCTSISGAMCDFWWNSLEEKKKIHWVSWERLCLKKQDGGLGFRDIQCFNQALLAKQAWRIIQFPDSLFARVLESRYFPEDSFLSSGLVNRPSFAWRSILHGRELLVSGLKKRIGNGESVRVWCDPWIFDERDRIPLMKNFSVDLNLMAKDLIDPGIRDWDMSILNDLFFQRDIDIIVARKPIPSRQDFWIWEHTRSGDYSVKTGYKIADARKNEIIIQEAAALPSINGLKAEVWLLKCPKKIQNFIWKSMSAAVPVVDKILVRGIRIDSRCQTCGLEGESINHVIFTCTVARQLWALSEIPCPSLGFNEESVFENMSYLLHLYNNTLVQINLRRIIPWVIWRLWKNRNDLLFEGKFYSLLDSVGKVKEDSRDWFLAQEVEVMVDSGSYQSQVSSNHRWKCPPSSWVKCNVGCVWSKQSGIAGMAWIIRDDKGSVILHSRSSVVNIPNKDEANRRAILWAIESLRFHRFAKVILAAQTPEIFGAIDRPPAWPSFWHHTTEIIANLEFFQVWKLQVESLQTNLGANLIAKSVIEQNRFQSYVALGGPFWLKEILELDVVNSSL